MAENADYYSRFVMAGRIRTHYIEAGDGMPVIFVHGGGPGASGEFSFRHQVTAMRQYGRAIALDLIGAGLSDKPDIEYSFQAKVNHLKNFLETLCIERVNLVGNSMGAYVAAKYTLDYPDRVNKLILIASGTIAGAMGLDIGMPEGLRRLLAYDGAKESLRSFLQSIVRHPENLTDELIEERHRLSVLPGAREALKSATEFGRRTRQEPNIAQQFDLRHRLPRLTTPALFVWGRKDTFAEVRLGEELEKMLPNIRFTYFGDSGHQVMNDEPDRFNQAAIEFFFGK